MPDETEGSSTSPPWSLDLRGTSAPVLVQVRRWAARTLDRVGDAHLGDVLLVVTELVTNAYDHGRGPSEIRMAYTPQPCRVRVEVDDGCSAHPVVANPSLTTPGGRGMLMVEKLAAAWGVREHRETGGKTVWAEVACDGAGAEPGG
ncbi:ATP-binding protein [Amycolatopsis balhimycina DSM 5908]|uniref:ATP-binding protein n=1 Tax=Amycolatopsis balhimycina DSM 5908 TaxID=1081091 RepID=A0A428WW21_AMYBA|nr:ATP-binding protein [Amycolatopsis balhimycina]RSM47281.1 ATP-binding protein [Amycolatopsis balhimycina DSM 5908]